MEAILEVKNLSVHFKTHLGAVKAVRDISFVLRKGETLAVVGESGCGKTVTAKSILKLLKTPPTIYGDHSEILFQGENVLKMDKRRLSFYRGGEVSMIFQDPMSSLNPTMTIGNQIIEALMIHKQMTKNEAKIATLDLLALVNIPNPEERFDAYPHEMSGGMRQRIMIAIALSCDPQILIADEPTTALDVTIQAQIIDLLRDLKTKMGTSIIVVTHDLGVVANFAQRVQVMYAGKIIESGPTHDIFYKSRHPYTWALLKSVPRLDTGTKEDLYSIGGTPPDLILPLTGCAFAPRCDYAMGVCFERAPESIQISDSHEVACWLNHSMADKEGLPFGFGGERSEYAKNTGK